MALSNHKKGASLWLASLFGQKSSDQIGKINIIWYLCSAADAISYFIDIEKENK